MQIELKKINIAIDGVSGCGKSSTAKEVARRLGFTYLDTGAMYRAVTYGLLKEKIDYQNKPALHDFLTSLEIHFTAKEQGWTTFLNGENVEMQIRSLEVSGKVSEISAIVEVREKLVELQRQSAREGGIVMDGRDIGTVVLPDADLKVFMTASPEVRAQRRQKELEENGVNEPFDKILENLLERDQKDSSREASPLVKAKDAILIDTSTISFEVQVKKILDLANEIMNERAI